MIDKLGGRRFILSCACLAVATFLQWAGKMDSAGNAYMLIVVGVVGVYVGGNVAERHSDNRFNRPRMNDDDKDRT